MIFNYIKLVTSSFAKCITYKNGANLLFSITISAGITTFEQITELQFLGINVTFLVLCVILILFDFFFGVLAERYVKKTNKIQIPKEKKIKYVDITIYKIITLFFLLWLTQEVYRQLFSFNLEVGGFWYQAVHTGGVVVQLCRSVVFSLICGKEYISIGENIEKRFGKKFYMFSIFEKLFDIIELKFIRKIADSKICEVEPEKINVHEKN